MSDVSQSQSTLPSWLQQISTVLLRKAMVALGTYLTAHNVLPASQIPALEQDAFGLGLAAVGVAWSLWSEWQKRQALKVAINSPAPAIPVK